MEERMGWREAFGTAWGNLTGVNNESASVRGIRLFFFLVFLGGTGWAAYNYFKYFTARQELEYKIHTPSSTASSLAADEKRLKAMVDQVSVSTEKRNNSSVIALTVADMGIYPFADPTIFPPTLQDIKVEGTLEIIPVPEPVEMPPDIVLRAIMVMGKQQVAVMDIVGVGSGMIVKAGDTFMQKKGRVVRITPDKVVMRWAGKNFDIRPNF